LERIDGKSDQGKKALEGLENDLKPGNAPLSEKKGEKPAKI
jgi:hypothetical protein